MNVELMVFATIVQNVVIFLDVKENFSVADMFSTGQMGPD